MELQSFRQLRKNFQRPEYPDVTFNKIGALCKNDQGGHRSIQHLYKLLQMFQKASILDKVLMLIFLLLVLAVLKR